MIPYGMKLPYLLLGFVPLLAMSIQSDGEIGRQTKLGAIKDWVGHWKVELNIKWPPEAQGPPLKGELDVKPDMGNSSLRFDGSVTGQGDTGPAKTIYISGQFTYDQSGSKPAYSAVFSWSEDGRIATARGEFRGKDLKMLATVPQPEGPASLNVQVTGGSPRRVIVTMPSDTHTAPTDFLVFTLTKA